MESGADEKDGRVGAVTIAEGGAGELADLDAKEEKTERSRNRQSNLRLASSLGEEAMVSDDDSDAGGEKNSGIDRRHLPRIDPLDADGRPRALLRENGSEVKIE